MRSPSRTNRRRRHGHHRYQPPHTPGLQGLTRHLLAIAIALIAVISANAALTDPDSVAIFEQYKELLLVVLGYYFGRR